jgi:hypothetical protein
VRRDVPDPKAAISAFLAQRRDDAADFLAELVKMPSDNPPGDCAPHAARAATLLEQMGFVVERHPLPQDAVAANGMVSCVNLVIRERFGPGPVIACNAHGDVVPPGAGWTADPYGAEVRDGRIIPEERPAEVEAALTAQILASAARCRASRSTCGGSSSPRPFCRSPVRTSWSRRSRARRESSSART